MFKKQKTQTISSSRQYDTFDFFLIGDADMGKTCLLNRFCNDFYSTYKKKKKKPEIFIVSTSNDNQEFRLQFWDFVFTEENMESNKRIIDKSDGIIFVCSFDNKESLNRIKYWYKLLGQYTDLNRREIVIFVNKNDLEDEIVISEDDIKQMSNELKTDYYEMSAKTGKGVKKAFGEFAQRVISKVYNYKSKYNDLLSNEGKNNNNQNCIIL